MKPKNNVGHPLTEKSKLVIKYLSKMDTKGLNWKRGLAKEIHKKHPEVFNSVESARNTIRTFSGAHGQKSRSNLNKYTETVNAKILILDIETAPMKAYVWGIWEQNISYGAIESQWFMLTWSAKWLFDKKVYSAKVTGKEAVKEDDKRITKSLWSLLNEADIVIAHNGDKFDIPRINTRFIFHGLNPPMPYLTIDTLKHVRKQFAMPSNKLDNVNRYLSLTPKKENDGMPLWINCIKGSGKHLKEMEAYNIQDVLSLEETYLKIRSWIKPHPNVGLYISEQVSCCPSCGCKELTEEGTYKTSSSLYDALRCNNCGSVSRKRKAIKGYNKIGHVSISK